MKGPSDMVTASYPKPTFPLAAAALMWVFLTLITTALLTVPAGWVQQAAPQTVAEAVGPLFCGDGTRPAMQITREYRGPSYLLVCLDTSGDATAYHYDDFTIAYMSLWAVPAAVISLMATWVFARPHED